MGSIATGRNPNSQELTLKRQLRATFAVATVVALLAACGSDSDDDASAASTDNGGAGASTQPGSDVSNAPADAQSATDLEPVRLGSITPLSGNFAAVGESFQNGVDLYLDQHDGQLGGRVVELVTVDEGAGAADAVPVARKLIQQDKVDVVTGVVSSATAAAVFPLFEQAKTPVVFSQGYPYPEPQLEASPFLWEPGSANAPFTISMGQYLAENVTGEGGVYFIASDYVQGHTVLDATMKAFEAAGGHVAGTDFAPLGTTLDFQPYITKIEQSGAAAVWSFFSGSDAVRFVEQFYDFGLADQLEHYSTGSLVAGANLEALGTKAVGIKTNSHYHSSLENPENEDFVSAYESSYGTAPDNFAMQQYDSMLILDQALSTVDGELTADKIVEGLRSVGDLTTARGPWRLHETAHIPVHSIYMFEVVEENGEVVNTLLEDLGVFDPVTGEPVR